jgi:hypothetical protein
MAILGSGKPRFNPVTGQEPVETYRLYPLEIGPQQHVAPPLFVAEVSELDEQVLPGLHRPDMDQDQIVSIQLELEGHESQHNYSRSLTVEAKYQYRN